MFDKSKLKKALKENDVAGVRALLKANRALLWKEINHRIPFFHAVRDGHDDIAIMIIDEFRFKPGQRYEGYTNAFFQMVAHGRLELFKRYQDNYTTVIMQDRQSYREYNLLHQAAIYGQLDFAKHLVAIGFDVLERDGGGKTALYHAEENGFAELVKFFKEAEALKRKPAAAAPRDKPVVAANGWQKLDDQRIALVREEKTLGLRYTDLFNFAAGDITRTVQNLSTKVESSAIVRISADSAEAREAAERLGIALDGRTLLISRKPAIPS